LGRFPFNHPSLARAAAMAFDPSRANKF